MSRPSCSYCGGKPRPPSRIPINYKCSSSYRAACSACAKLKAIDERIRDARLALDRLLDEREAMAGLVNQKHDSLTTRLPVEMITRIFGHCVPEFERNPRTALHLAAVCQRWRNVVHGTPFLWTNITVAVTGSSLGKDTILEACLARSGDLELSVRIAAPQDGREGSVSFESFVTSLTLVCRHSQRWKTLLYHGDTTTLDLIATSATSLEKLGILSLGMLGEPTQNAINLKAAPSNLSTNISPKEWGIHIGYQKLTVAGEGSALELLFSHCIELFQEAPQLEVCHIGTITWGEFAVPQCPVAAHSLHTLSVRYIPAIFWDFLEFPSLVDLEIGESGTAGWVKLIRCLARSHCHIQQLSITESPPSNHAVIDLLSATPHLRRLFLGIEAASAELFSMMYKSVTPHTPEAPKSEQFLARLTTLTCSPSTQNACSWLVMFLDAMTTHREQTLRSFTFACDEVGIEAIKTIQAVVDKAMLGHILTLAGRLELTMRDLLGGDVLPKLCAYYGVAFSARVV